MSLLDEQLKELQTRKLRVEYFKFLKSKIGDVAKDSFKEVEKEIKDLLFSYIDNQINQIELGKIDNPAINELSTEDIAILKVFIEKIKNTTAQDQVPKKAEIAPIAPIAPQNAPTTSKPDKISFALKHRALGGKTVEILSRNRERGTVVGIDAPNIVVQLLSGSVIQADLTDINIV
jgi:hypothetical protein